MCFTATHKMLTLQLSLYPSKVPLLNVPGVGGGRDELHLELFTTMSVSEQNKAYMLFTSPQITSLIFLY